MKDRYEAAYLVSGFGAPDQKTAVVGLHLTKALDPTYSMEDRLAATHRIIVHGTNEQQTALAPFFLMRALELTLPLEERVKAARSAITYGTPEQKIQILMKAMSEPDLHQNFLGRNDTPEAVISPELQTYLLTQATNLWQNLQCPAIYAMIHTCSRQRPDQWATTIMETMPNYGQAVPAPIVDEGFED